jgi:hypothetical protein
MTEEPKISIKKLTKSLFPGSQGKKVSIQQLNQIFANQQPLQSEHQQQQPRPMDVADTLISLDQHQQRPLKKPTAVSVAATTPKSKSETTLSSRAEGLARMDIQKLKDLCLTKYRVDCGELKKKKDVISILIREELYQERRRRKNKTASVSTKK